MSFYLKYTNDNWATDTELEITSHVRNVYEPYVERATGVNLNGTDYAHILYKKNERLLNISADFLATASNFTFIKNFFQAGAWRYSDDGETYTDVVLKENGKLSPDYIEGHIGLPDITLTLIDKEAS